MTPIAASRESHISGFPPGPSLANDFSTTATADDDGDNNAHASANETEPEPEKEPLEKTTGESQQTQAIGLTEGELRLVQALKRTDTKVRTHEMAHIAAGGQYVTSGARLQYQRGPDGINYAVAGEVSIDTSPVPGDPRATIQKMRRVKAAALAPASPSAQDRKVAANAAAATAKATSELMMLRTAERAGSTKQTAGTTPSDAATTYASMAEEATQQGTLLDIAA